jgi:hypothetical protein
MDVKTVVLVVGAAAFASAAGTAIAQSDSEYEDCDEQACHVAALANEDCSTKEAKPKKIKVKKSGADIFWWAPNGYQFCVGDGPGFKRAGDDLLYGDQFPVTERCRTTTTSVNPAFACPTPQPACAPYFHWKSRGAAKVTIEYDLTITNIRSKRKCTIDPWIKNG